MMRVRSALVVIVSLSAPAAVTGQNLPAGLVSGGYSHLANPTAISTYGSDESGNASHSGWFAEAIGNMTPHIGVVGEVSATYTTATVSGRAEHAAHHAYSFLGGGRTTSRCCRGIAPFGQVLVGLVRINTQITSAGRDVSRYQDLYFGLTFGGGLDIRFGDGPAGLHVAADVVRINDLDRGHTWRMLVGLTVPMR